MTFSNQVDKKYDNYEDYYLNLANIIFNYLNLNAYFIFEVDLVSLEEIHKINKEYRHVDRPTDVISFAFEDNNDFSNLKSNEDLPRDLGEIFICVDKAKNINILLKEKWHFYLLMDYYIYLVMIIKMK